MFIHFFEWIYFFNKLEDLLFGCIEINVFQSIFNLFSHNIIIEIVNVRSKKFQLFVDFVLEIFSREATKIKKKSHNLAWLRK